MLVGILSDSHGDVLATRDAIALLEKQGATKLFHCGDLCSDSVLAELTGHDCTFVWGNCDDPTPTTRKFVQKLGLKWPEMPTRVEVAHKRIGLYHGHEVEFSSAAGAGLDYVFYGHTHRYNCWRENGTCFINPGALYRASVHTVALLDLATGMVKFLRLDDGVEVPLGKR